MIVVGGRCKGLSYLGTFYSHVVVKIASLQDFKQSWNSQVGPSVATIWGWAMPSSVQLQLAVYLVRSCMAKSQVNIALISNVAHHIKQVNHVNNIKTMMTIQKMLILFLRIACAIHDLGAQFQFDSCYLLLKCSLACCSQFLPPGGLLQERLQFVCASLMVRV